MIIAFLSEPWFRPGASVQAIERFNEDPVYRRSLLATTKLGGRLMYAFREFYAEIDWDTVCPQGTYRREHIFQRIVTLKPNVVISIGGPARDLVHGVWHGNHCVANDTEQGELNRVAMEVLSAFNHLRTARNR